MLFALLVSYAVMSFITFGVMVIDKQRAVHSRRRISESTLHLLELVGGWPGSLLAQRLVRHKNRKLKYQIVFWAIVALHITGLSLLWW